MHTAETLITEYFNITGRPISTMTVEEYLSFVKMSNVMTVPSVELKTEGREVASKETVILPVEADIIDTPKKVLVEPESITSSDNIVELPKQRKQAEKPAATPDLNFLRSFSG